MLYLFTRTFLYNQYTKVCINENINIVKSVFRCTVCNFNYSLTTKPPSFQYSLTLQTCELYHNCYLLLWFGSLKREEYRWFYLLVCPSKSFIFPLIQNFCAVVVFFLLIRILCPSIHDDSCRNLFCSTYPEICSYFTLLLSCFYNFLTSLSELLQQYLSEHLSKWQHSLSECHYLRLVAIKWTTIKS